MHARKDQNQQNLDWINEVNREQKVLDSANNQVWLDGWQK